MSIHRFQIFSFLFSTEALIRHISMVYVSQMS